MRIAIAILGLLMHGALCAAETIATDASGVRLVGDLHLPSGAGPHPVVVIAPGSGRHPRGAAFLSDYIERFNEAGLGLVLYDKRGVGDSGGEYEETPWFHAAADDLAAIARAVASRPDIARVGSMGFSQGGWIAPLAAVRCQCLAFVASVSGPAVSPMEQNLFQRAQELLDRGVPRETVAEISALMEIVWRYQATGQGHLQAREALAAATARPWFESSGFSTNLAEPAALGDARFDFHRKSAHDAQAILMRLDVPALFVFGGADRHIPVDASLSVLARQRLERPDQDLTVRVFPGAGHLLTLVPGGIEIIDPEQRPSYHEVARWPRPDGYWPALLDWLRSRAMASFDR